MGVSRVSLNKAVVWEFGISAAPSAGTAAVAGNKNDLLFTAFSVKGMAFRLHFISQDRLI